MITKNNLIDILEKSLVNEDEFIMRYGTNFLDNVNKADILTNEEKEEIKNLLTDMLEDTKRHKKTINLLIEKIKRGKRNEF